MTRCEVQVYTICGKQARQLIFKEIKQNMRNRKLKRLIVEVRKLRRLINDNHNCN
jgi:ribosomal protein L18E